MRLDKATILVLTKKSCGPPRRTGSTKKPDSLKEGSQTKGFVPLMQRLQLQQGPRQDRKLFILMYHLETLPKGYNLSRPSGSVQECILHRSAHLLSVSAILVQKGLCCSKHIALFPSLLHPRGGAGWGRDRCSAPTDNGVSIQHPGKGTR